MQPNSPSRTAIAAAFLRALHPVADDPPWVFEDPLATAFLPWYQQRFLERLAALPSAWRQVFRQRRSALGRMRAQILVRSRYTEDTLATVRAAGISRYLILAAGLDTFAWRQDDCPVPVVEVDHPATQAWKRDMLKRQGRPLPAGVDLQPIDFEQQSLAQVIPPAAGPQFVSWLGTSYYLTPPAMHATLTALADLSPRGSRLVLDYWQADFASRQSPRAGWDGMLLWGTRMATALQQEPMRCFLTPAQLRDMAESSGWRVEETLNAAAQNARYLTGRRDDLAVPEFAYVALLARDGG